MWNNNVKSWFRKRSHWHWNIIVYNCDKSYLIIIFRFGDEYEKIDLSGFKKKNEMKLRLFKLRKKWREKNFKIKISEWYDEFNIKKNR